MVRPASGRPRPALSSHDATFTMGGDDAREGRGAGSKAPADGDLPARLKALDAQLDRQRDGAAERVRASARSASDPSAIGRAFRMSTEFVAGVVAGGGIGWLFDYALGTSPGGLIVFLLLGFAAGVFNVVRAAGTSGPAAGAGSKPQNDGR
jgi:ATP synthase protein I